MAISIASCRKWVTILILIDGFLQFAMLKKHLVHTKVTILILIDGFLQFNDVFIKDTSKKVSQSLF